MSGNSIQAQLRLNSPISVCDPVEFSQCWRLCIASPIWTQTGNSVMLESRIVVPGCDCAPFTAQLVVESDQQAVASNNNMFYSSIVASNAQLQMRIDYEVNTSTCTAMYCVTGGVQSVLGVPLHGCVNEGSTIAAGYWWAILIGCFAFCCVFSSVFVRRRAVWPTRADFAPATPVVVGVPVGSPQPAIPMATAVERSEASSTVTTPQAEVISQNKTPPLPSAFV